ncbi:hypothetical protein CEUSTIGMA_g1796.t1 [Chlamydomonas eustigma]|uniref:RING-type E3 ubiquitin transferase n=1 Tax=Chlamydomonas eustigma TaxID=1157962 RepID=A0A250WU43_9CHLO|nr:hypothetical protein CEUSTIGMA_g1796.t1 [Chlamydomonas eustigma]|eukprot:GAX74347.1 hypothetical protein CEUSTIGMA_g1796.t1 [Chlamydomonas eustigma]
MLDIILLIYASVLFSRSQGRPLQEHHSHNTSSAVRNEIPFTSYFGNSAISEELWTEYGGKHSKGSIEYKSAFNGQNLGGKYRGTWRVAPVMLLDPQKQNEGGLGNVSTGEELIEGADLAGQTLDPRAELAGQKHTNVVRGGIMVQQRQAAVSSSVSHAPMSMLNDGGYMLLSLKSRDTTSRGVVKEVVGELILHDGFHLSAESVVHMELSGLWTQHPDPSNDNDPDVLADTPGKSVARRKRGSATSPPYFFSSTFPSDSRDAVTSVKSVKTLSSSNSRLAAGKGGNKQQPRTAGHLLALLKYKPSNREARDLQSQGKSAKSRPFWGPLSSASSTSSLVSHPAAGDDASQILPALSEELSSASASSAAPAAAAAPAARADAAAPAAYPAEAGTPSPLLLSSKFDTIVESAAAAAAASNQDPLLEDSPQAPTTHSSSSTHQGFSEYAKSVADDVDGTVLPPPLAAGIVALPLAAERSRSLQGLLAADTGSSSSSTWHHDYRAALRSAGWKLAAGTLQIPWGSREETRAAGVHPKGAATGSTSGHGLSSSQHSRRAASPGAAAAVWSSSRHDSKEIMKSPASSTSFSSSSTRWWPWKRGHTSDGGTAELVEVVAGHLQTGTATSTATSTAGTAFAHYAGAAAATADGPPGATGVPLGRNNQKQRQASSSLGSVSAWLVEMLHMEVECEVWMDVWIQEGQILESTKMAHVDGLSSTSHGGQYDQDSLVWSASVDNVLLADEAVLRPSIKGQDMAAGIGMTNRANVESSVSSDGDEGAGRGWRGLPGTNDMQMVGTIRSSNCGGSMLILQGGGVDMDSVISHFYYYVYYMVFITLSQGVGQIAQMIHTGENTESLSRLSSMSLRMHAVQDNFMCLVHLLIGLTVDDLFWPCMGLCILQFVEFGVLQVQYILLVWRIQQPSSDLQRNREDMHNQQASHYVDLIFLCILVAAFVAESAPAPHSVIGGDLSNMHQDNNPPPGIIVNSSSGNYDYTSLLSPPEVVPLSGTSSVRAWQYSPLLLMLGGLPALIQACPLLLLIPLTSVWVPQILKCIATESRPPLLFTYVLWSSVGRLAVPLYLLVVPWGLQQSPSWLLAQACVLIVWMVMQVLALDCLRRYGPRRLLPAFLLPKRYDYHRPATAQELGSRAIQPASTSSTIQQTILLAGDQQQPSTSLSRLPGVAATLAAGGTASATIPLLGAAAPVLAPAASAGGAGSSRDSSIVPADIEEGRAPHSSTSTADAALAAECVICMCPVPLVPEANRLLTPCGHFFHEPCLRRWSEVKLECPYCRRRLPPLHEHEDHGAGDEQGGSSHLDEDADASNNVEDDGGTTFMNQLMHRLMGQQLMQRRRQQTAATTTRRVMLGP